MSARSAAKIGVLILVFGVAIWLRFQFTANSRTFNRYMDGVSMMQTGRPYEAVAAWEALLRDDPRFPDTYLRLAEYYNANGNPSRAAELLREAASRRLDAAQREEQCELLAEALNNLPDSMAAVHAAQAAVKAYPASARAHLALAAADTKITDQPGVISEMAAAERLNPSDAGEYLLGAQYSFADDDPDQTEQQARECVKLAPNSADGWYLLGWALESRPTPDRLAESITDLRRATELNATAYSTWLELGNALNLSGQTAAAIPYVEHAQTIAAGEAPMKAARAVKLLQDRMRISHLLVECYQDVGNLAKATGERRDSDRLANELLMQYHQTDNH